MTMFHLEKCKPPHELAVWTKRQLLKGLSQLLTRQDLARMCQINQRTLSTWIERHQLPEPVYIAPNTPRWMPDEVEKWLNTRPRERSAINGSRIYAAAPPAN